MNPTERPTILLVDDDEDLLMMMRTSFERAGYNVVARKSAPARDEVEQLGPSVIFMDVELESDNGAALCHALKRGGVNMDQHIILISGHAENTLSQEAMSALADGCISKPFNMISLHELAAFYTQPHN
jgi:CheY-like chemotaxis protein